MTYFCQQQEKTGIYEDTRFFFTSFVLFTLKQISTFFLFFPQKLDIYLGKW